MSFEPHLHSSLGEFAEGALTCRGGQDRGIAVKGWFNKAGLCSPADTMEAEL